MRRSRKLFLVAATVVALVGALGVVALIIDGDRPEVVAGGDGESRSDVQQRVAIPVQRATPTSQEATEATIAFGDHVAVITVTFGPPLSVIRGACWVGERWNGSQWVDPFLATAHSIGRALDRPRADPPTDPTTFGCEDIGYEGEGPQTITLPADFLIADARYRFCELGGSNDEDCFTTDIP